MSPHLATPSCWPFHLVAPASALGWNSDHAQRLEELRFIPDFLAYLSHILVHCTSEEGNPRAVAGLILKNAVTARTGQSDTPADTMAMAYVKTTVLVGLSEPDTMIRHTVGTVIMSILFIEETGAWPEALDALTKGIQSQDANLVEVSDGCL